LNLPRYFNYFFLCKNITENVESILGIDVQMWIADIETDIHVSQVVVWNLNCYKGFFL